MDVGPAYERGGAHGGRSPTGLRRIPATLVVAEQHSLSPESNPRGLRSAVRSPPAHLPPCCRPPPRRAVGLFFGPRRTHVPTPPMTSSKPETFREGTAGRAPALAAQDKWADESLQSSTFIPGAPIFCQRPPQGYEGGSAPAIAPQAKTSGRSMTGEGMRGLWSRR